MHNVSNIEAIIFHLPMSIEQLYLPQNETQFIHPSVFRKTFHLLTVVISNTSPSAIATIASSETFKDVNLFCLSQPSNPICTFLV